MCIGGDGGIGGPGGNVGDMGSAGYGGGYAGDAFGFAGPGLSGGQSSASFGAIGPGGAGIAGGAGGFGGAAYPSSYTNATQMGPLGNTGNVPQTVYPGVVPTTPAPASTANPTFNYPTPMEMYNTIGGLPAYQMQWNLLQNMNTIPAATISPSGTAYYPTGMPYANQIYDTIQAQAAAGLPFSAEQQAALNQMSGIMGNLQGYIGGLGGMSASPGTVGFYGDPLKSYLDQTRRKGLVYAPQQENILKAMTNMNAFQSAVLPQVQDVMRGIGRSGYASGSAADRAISDTLGSLYNQWQWNALQGYQNLGQQMQNFQNNLMQGYANYGTLGNQYGANQVGMANVGAQMQGNQLQAISSAYNTLGNLGSNLATGWGNLGTNTANYNQGNLNNLGQLSSNIANYNTGLLNSLTNYNTGMNSAMNQWYAPYNTMLGYVSA